MNEAAFNFRKMGEIPIYKYTILPGGTYELDQDSAGQ
jgi:hypothetical protein